MSASAEREEFDSLGQTAHMKIRSIPIQPAIANAIIPITALSAFCGVLPSENPC
jgi:hypothetical protein